MSSRFHNKYHRHNHHTASDNDYRYPDAAHDPIASFDSPFLGDFVMFGTLSAIADSYYSEVSGFAAGHFASQNVALIAQAPVLNGIAFYADGNALITNTLSTTDLTITNAVATFTEPVTATGEFLIIRMGDQPRAIRLWQFTL